MVGPPILAPMRRVLLCALLVSGCSPVRVVPPETDRAARAALDSLRPDTMQLVGATGFRSFKRDFQQWTLDYQLHNQSGWAAARVVVATSAGKRLVGGIRVFAEPESLAVRNALTWRNASPAGLLALFAALNLAIFCIVSGVVVARTPMPWRWAWALGSLVGLGALRVPWSQGVVSSREWSIHLLSVGLAHATRFSPWVVTLSLPVGAILALERRRRFLSPTEPRPAPPVTIPRGFRIAIGAIEIASGAWAILVGYRDPIVVVVAVVAIAGGGLLCLGRRAGVLVSRVIQAIQVVRVYTSLFAFGIVMGPEATFVWTNASHDFIVGYNLRFDLAPSDKHGIEINLVAVLFLAWLLIRWRRRGDP